MASIECHYFTLWSVWSKIACHHPPGMQVCWIMLLWGRYTIWETCIQRAQLLPQQSSLKAVSWIVLTLIPGSRAEIDMGSLDFFPKVERTLVRPIGGIFHHALERPDAHFNFPQTPIQRPGQHRVSAEIPLSPGQLCTHDCAITALL